MGWVLEQEDRLKILSKKFLSNFGRKILPNANQSREEYFISLLLIKQITVSYAKKLEGTVSVFD